MKTGLAAASAALILTACAEQDAARPESLATATASATEAVRTVYDGFAAGDMALATSRFADDMEWREAEGHAYADGNPYTGAERIVGGVFARFGQEWTGFAAVPDRFVEQDGHVVVLGRYRGTFTPTGRTLDAPFAHVWTVEGDRITSYTQFTDTAAWNDTMDR